MLESTQHPAPTGPAAGRARIPTTLHSTAPTPERAIVVGVDTGRNKNGWSEADSIRELAQLAETAGAEVVGETIQRLQSPHPAHYVGSGKLEEIAEQTAELESNLVLFDDELSPSQQRNIEKALKVKVLDRTALILDIFAGRAQTHEGRLQVELAQLEYLLPRLAGQWSHLERLGGGIGTRGPGETQIETDRRLIRNRIAQLRREIEDVRRHRSLHRERRVRSGLPLVALVGYTNAGKSTLLNKLTNAGVVAEDKLFATLDPTVRRTMLPNGQEVLLSDTVGFIQKLPTTLVAAFRATLEELETADLLLHVVDISSESAAEQAETVDQILGELELGEKPRLLVLNKVDRLLPEDRIRQASPAELLAEVRATAGANPDAVLVSATRDWGLDDLRQRISERVADNMVNLRVTIPYGAERLVHLFRTAGTVRAEQHRDDGTWLEGRVPRHLAPQFADYVAE